MSSPRAIFFDIGDTLVFDDPPLPERLWQAIQSVGMASEKSRFRAAYRQGEIYAVARCVEGVPWDVPEVQRETVTRILAAMNTPLFSELEWAELIAAFGAVPFRRCAHPGAIPLLEELRLRGFILGGISDWEDTLPNLLAELQITPYFEALAVSALVGVRKPDRRLFDEALRQTGIRPDEALHVGDWHELDICGAHAAGMQTLLFDWAGRQLNYNGPRVVSFEELGAYLLALPSSN